MQYRSKICPVLTRNGFFSQTKIVRCGIPHGSTLVPLLFLIYINDLKNALDRCIVHHFGDDSNLLFGKKCPSGISCVMNSEQKLLTDWLRANKLPLNESKTKFLIFRPRRRQNVMRCAIWYQSLFGICMIVQMHTNAYPFV